MLIQLLTQKLKIGNQPNVTPIEGPLVGINTPADIINKIIPILISAASIILFIMLVLGGFQFLTSGGNAEKVKLARGKLTYALVGFVLLIISYIIVKLISQIFGIGTDLF